jgi:hypothetical protein
MLRKNKIKIVGGSWLLLFFIGGLFLWHYMEWKNLNKKVELNLQQDFVADPEVVSVEKNAETSNSDQKTVQEQVSARAVFVNNSANSNDKNSVKKNEVTGVDATDLVISNELVSWGFQKSDVRKIDSLIVHSSYDAIGNDPYNVSGLIAEYKSYGVSPHYLIDRNGKIYRLVSDQNIAYQAGESRMPDGRTNVNNFSLGVEIVETKSDSPTQKQYDSLNGLVAYLKGKYPIVNILGHNQIAPGRKDDPWNFDWSKVKK